MVTKTPNVTAIKTPSMETSPSVSFWNKGDNPPNTNAAKTNLAKSKYSFANNSRRTFSFSFLSFCRCNVFSMRCAISYSYS